MEQTLKPKPVKARKEGGLERMETSEIVFKVLSYLFIGVFALMCVYPLIYSLSCAISGLTAVDTGKVVLWPIDVQWDALKVVLLSQNFWIGYCNTLFITLYGTIYCMILSILGAYALSKKRMFGNKFFNFLLIFTMWFSAGTVPMLLNYQDTLRIMNSNLGIGDLKWVVVVAMGMSAFNVILLRNAFDSVPSEIEEAATVDGANDFQIMSKIFVPMSKATVATVALFFGISRWNGYFWAMEVLGDYKNYVPLQVFIQTEIAKINEQSAAGGANLVGTYAPMSVVYSMIVCAIIPILVIYPFIQKYFAAGVNMGGVKE